MSTSIVVDPDTKASVGMGQILLARDPACLITVLGSCIGLTLYHERLRIGAMAHIMLPQSHGRKGSPGKFADTAIPEILKMMQSKGANPAGLVAKIVGGGQYVRRLERSHANRLRQCTGNILRTRRGQY